MNVTFHAFHRRPKAPQIGTTERTSSTDEVECDSTRSDLSRQRREGASQTSYGTRRKGMEVAKQMSGSTGRSLHANHRSDWFLP